MSKMCISKCAGDGTVPVRATYVNLYKWPGSDAEFVRSVAVHGGAARLHSRVVDSISCRQLYLRSYTFSRKETVPERTVRCFGKVGERVAAAAGMERRKRRRLNDRSRAAVRVVLRKLLLCTTVVDVAN